MILNPIQQKVGEILDAYGLPNVRALRDRAAEIKSREPASKEALLLDFVAFAYDEDCLRQEDWELPR